MQIREKGRKVLCIKTEYIPEKKRTIGKTVASQDKYLSTASESVRQHLSKDEVDELNNWLSEREKKANVDSLKLSLSTINYSLSKAAEGLDEGIQVSEEKAQAIYAAVDRLQKSLRKAGFKRAKKAKNEAADIRQSGLF